MRALLWLCAWLFATVLLSAPTVLYVILLYLPEDNSLGVSAQGAAVLRRVVPWFLAATNSVFLPMMSRLVARMGLCMPAAQAGAVSALLLLAARLLTTVVLPLSAARAGRGVRRAVEGVLVTVHRQQHVCSVQQCNRLLRPWLCILCPVGEHKRMSLETLCGGAPGVAGPHCARATLEAAPLFAEKLAIEAFCNRHCWSLLRVGRPLL